MEEEEEAAAAAAARSSQAPSSAAAAAPPPPRRSSASDCRQAEAAGRTVEVFVHDSVRSLPGYAPGAAMKKARRAAQERPSACTVSRRHVASPQ